MNDAICMFVVMTGTESLPKECQDKLVLDYTLRNRYESLGGETVRQWAQRCLTGGDKACESIDWTVAGAYRIIWEGGLIRALVHRRSGTRADVPDGLVLDRTFSLHFPTSEKAACLKKGSLQTYVCFEFFGQGQHLAMGGQPWLDKKGKQLKQLVAAAVEQARTDRAEAAEATAPVDVGSLTDHAAERKKRALELARVTMAQRPKKSRTVDFADDQDDSASDATKVS